MNSLTEYIAHRWDMKTGDLLEWRSDGGVGKAIRQADGEEVNHDSMILISEEFPQATRVFSYEALAYGFFPHRLSYELESFKGSVIWYELNGISDLRRMQIGTWLVNHIGIGYDYLSLFRNLVEHVTADDQKLFCSEAAFLALRDGGNLINGERAPRPGELVRWYPKIFKPGVKIL